MTFNEKLLLAQKQFSEIRLYTHYRMRLSQMTLE